ncbi:unnamed protein product [Didymodactylos carnosus]|uniref:Uncharacterized protein n=1 Tax=Didymodactylos carnosus TaxID=1234261 RepID=A0A8S2VKJ9_9BILA|nr:unnamed protein product [Didymodactylos carnosus]CAF3669347.1 unnamed protein product [Didymodactylos carnosus]CAF4395364.1 unnamed protein product [Didymodactylos carnosus]
MENHGHLPNCPNHNSSTLWLIKTACSCQSPVSLSSPQSPQTQLHLSAPMLPPKQPKTIQQKAILHAAATKNHNLPHSSHHPLRRNSTDCVSQPQPSQLHREEENRRSSLFNSLPPILEYNIENNNRLLPTMSPVQGHHPTFTVFPPEAICSIYEQRYNQAQQLLQHQLHRPSGFLNIESTTNHRLQDNRITPLVQYPYASPQQQSTFSSPQQERKDQQQQQQQQIQTQLVREVIFYKALGAGAQRSCKLSIFNCYWTLLARWSFF